MHVFEGEPEISDINQYLEASHALNQILYDVVMKKFDISYSAMYTT